MEIDPDSGSSSHEPFAYFDRDSCSWRTCQGSLLADSGEFCSIWPMQGTWDRGFAWELATSALRIDETGFSSSLLPTPSAYESTPTEEFSEEVRANLTDPGSRLYLPGRKWHAQRTLSRIAGALLPTPGANDHTGAEKETREARRAKHGTGGSSLRDLPKMLPTPIGSDAKNPGAPQNPQLREVASLLPTPQT